MSDERPNKTAADASNEIPADLDEARRDCRALYALLEASRAHRDGLQRHNLALEVENTRLTRERDRLAAELCDAQAVIRAAHAALLAGDPADRLYRAVGILSRQALADPPALAQKPAQRDTELGHRILDTVKAALAQKPAQRERFATVSGNVRHCGLCNKWVEADHVCEV